MSGLGSGLQEKEINQNADPGGHLSVLQGTHNAAAASPETQLLSAFKTDSQGSKVYLSGRGEFWKQTYLFNYCT